MTASMAAAYVGDNGQSANYSLEPLSSIVSFRASGSSMNTVCLSSHNEGDNQSATADRQGILWSYSQTTEERDE